MPNFASTIRQLKTRLMPDGTEYRAIRFGLCAGIQYPINLRRRMRYYLGLHEAELIPYFKRYSKPGITCYDIGANTGYYTLALHRLCSPGGRIIAVEPIERWHTDFNELLARNAHQVQQPGSASIQLVPYFLGTAEQAQTNPHYKTLDTMVFNDGYPMPDLIKMDIEGAEIDVLHGATRVLAECAPRWIIEVHGADIEQLCLDVLHNAGYHVTIVNQNPWLLQHRILTHNRWLCAHKP